MSKSLEEIQQVLAIAHNALQAADKICFPIDGSVSVVVAQARDIVKAAVCDLEFSKKNNAIVSKELLKKHVKEIDEWNANMNSIVGHDPDYFWDSLEALRTYIT